ncbi:MAG: imidazole glycerol phosphate synthase subunit HisH [Rhizobiales bacterium]|nr:imidazole glycerol phosphate synthase subunit HisH [Hyphomicrobiales bacterium]
MNVAIIDYGSGNLHSAAKAFERAAADNAVAAKIAVVSDADDLRKADRIVLPGVGAFRDCRDGLEAVAGMREALEQEIIRRGKPFLGICVGMQLMAERGLEHGEAQGLGWIAGDVVAIEPRDKSYKIPHMGWNTLEALKRHTLLEGIPTGTEGRHAYFVHSFHLRAGNRDDVIAETDHGGAVTAMVGRDNLVGVQFHPEKSQALGLALIANFLRWMP